MPGYYTYAAVAQATLTNLMLRNAAWPLTSIA